MAFPRLAAAFSPFAVRSYRFQWSADLLTSCAIEMETVLLVWFLVVETESVLLVALFGALQFLGTLAAPMLGLVGDRIGHRRLLLLLRLCFTALAALGAVLVLAGLLSPWLVLALAGVAGLARPSDTGIRSVLITETVPGDSLMKAIGLSRITQDSARGAGALAGGAIVLLLGMGAAYWLAVALYALGMALTLGVAARAVAAPSARPSPLRDLAEAARAVRQAPTQLAAMLVAFVVNLTAYPFTLGLLPYVARDVYGTTQLGLGWMVAAVSAGCIAASLLLSVLGRAVPPGRTVLLASLAWHALVVVFGQVGSLGPGLVLLVLIGVAQMACVLPISVLLLRDAPAALRGRIMGLRTLAVYGLPIGLLASGPVIEGVGFGAAAALYGAAGAAATLAVLVVWRAALWARGAKGNAG